MAECTFEYACNLAGNVYLEWVDDGDLVVCVCDGCVACVRAFYGGGVAIQVVRAVGRRSVLCAIANAVYGVFGVVVDDGATCSVLGASTMGLFVREADAADAPRANMEYAPNATSAVEAPNTAMSCQMNPLRASHKCDILDK